MYPLKIKDTIDFDKLRNGMYKIDDIIDNNVKQRIIGYIDKNPVFLKMENTVYILIIMIRQKVIQKKSFKKLQLKIIIR